MHVEPSCGLDFVIYMLKYMFCWHIPPLNAVFRWAHATWCQRYHPWAAAHTEKRKTERDEFITPPRPTGRRSNKTPAQAFTPPADEKKMGTIWILVCYAVYGSERGRCRNFLVLKFGGGGLDLRIWDLNRAHETERTVFPIQQVFSMRRRKLWHKRKHKGYSTNSAMNTFTINKACWQ